MLRLKLFIASLRSEKTLNKRKEVVLRMTRSESPQILILKWFLKTATILFFGGLIIFPFIFMIFTSLMPQDQVYGNPDAPGLIPDSYNWSNFAKSMADGYWFALLNTILVAALSISLQIIVSMLMGYGLAFKKFHGKKIIWYFLLSLLMLPQIALIVGQYVMVVRLGIQTGFASILAMVLPYAASIFSGYMFKNAFEAIPLRTKEAALLDGIGDFKFFAKIAMPMATPTAWTVGILTAFASWNAYMWPALLSVGASDFRTVLGIWLFDTGKIYDDSGSSLGVVMNLRMAAAIIVMAPLFIIYFAFRKRIMDAVAKRGSAIKG